jgi:hypothetical protein
MAGANSVAVSQDSAEKNCWDVLVVGTAAGTSAGRHSNLNIELHSVVRKERAWL